MTTAEVFNFIPLIHAGHTTLPADSLLLENSGSQSVVQGPTQGLQGLSGCLKRNEE